MLPLPPVRPRARLNFVSLLLTAREQGWRVRVQSAVGHDGTVRTVARFDRGGAVVIVIYDDGKPQHGIVRGEGIVTVTRVKQILRG